MSIEVQNEIREITSQNKLLARQNRLLIAVIGVLLTGLAVGAASTKDVSATTVTAEAFVLTDGKGKPRGRFEMEKTGPTLTLLHPDQKRAFYVRVVDNAPTPVTSLSLLYPQEKGAVTLVVTDNPSFGARNKSGRFVFHLGKVGQQPPVIEVFDDEGNRVSALGGPATSK